MKIKSLTQPRFVLIRGELVPVIDACYLGNDTWFVVIHAEAENGTRCA
jgi:hypothetical protein